MHYWERVCACLFKFILFYVYIRRVGNRGIHSSIPLDRHIVSHNTQVLFTLPILSFSLYKFFLLFRSAPLFIPLCLSTCLSLFRSLFFHRLFPYFSFPLSYFFLSFRDSFIFLSFCIYFTVCFILSLFVTLRFILFPSVSLYNVFSLSLS